jgi:hypothetical protein
MDITNSQTLYIGIFFLFILLSGFWVARAGKPYDTFVFTIHKLVGLGTGIFLIRTIYLTHQAAPLNSAQWTCILIMALLFLVTVAAGGLLSILDSGNLQSMSQPARTAVSLVHKFSPYIIIVSTGVTLFLLLS